MSIVYRALPIQGIVSYLLFFIYTTPHKKCLRESKREEYTHHYYTSINAILCH
jgi:hypothetical protein